MIEAVVRTLAEPLPPGGWFIGQWRIEELSQNFTIRFFSKVLLNFKMEKQAYAKHAECRLQQPHIPLNATTLTHPELLESWKSKDWLHWSLLQYRNGSCVGIEVFTD